MALSHFGNESASFDQFKTNIRKKAVYIQIIIHSTYILCKSVSLSPVLSHLEWWPFWQLAAIVEENAGGYLLKLNASQDIATQQHLWEGLPQCLSPSPFTAMGLRVPSPSETPTTVSREMKHCSTVFLLQICLHLEGVRFNVNLHCDNICIHLFHRKANSSPSAMEFDFFAEVCEMMGFLNGTWEDISSVCTLLHQLLECILLHDIYQVRNIMAGVLL